MNAGTQQAQGDVFWFLHAECLPHSQSISSLKNALTDPEVVGGGFEYKLNAPGWMSRFSEFMSNHKNHLLQLLYGDMGIFVRREIFENIDYLNSKNLYEPFRDYHYTTIKDKTSGKSMSQPMQFSPKLKEYLTKIGLKMFKR